MQYPVCPGVKCSLRCYTLSIVFAADINGTCSRRYSALLSIFTSASRNLIQNDEQPVNQSFFSVNQRLLFSLLACLLFMPSDAFVYVTVASKYTCPKPPPAKALAIIQARKRKVQVPANSSSDEEWTPPTSKCQLLLNCELCFLISQ